MIENMVAVGCYAMTAGTAGTEGTAGTAGTAGTGDDNRNEACLAGWVHGDGEGFNNPPRSVPEHVSAAPYSSSSSSSSSSCAILDSLAPAPSSFTFAFHLPHRRPPRPPSFHPSPPSLRIPFPHTPPLDTRLPLSRHGCLDVVSMRNPRTIMLICSISMYIQVNSKLLRY